jgi:hypothetical protein
MGECRLVTFCCLEVVTLRRALGIHLGVHYQHERMNRDVFLNAPGESHAQANSQTRNNTASRRCHQATHAAPNESEFHQSRSAPRSDLLRGREPICNDIA